jgi:CRISPR/Cas system-associated exonuclease Cas4 (RecB family)
MAAVVNDGVYVSASSLRLLQDCPRAFSYKYISGHKPEDVGSALVLGKACHAALADWYQRLRDGSPSPSIDELVAIASLSIEEARKGPTPIATDEDEPDLVAEATRMLRAFLVSNPYRPTRVLAVEMPFTVRVGRHPVTGERFEFEESIAGVLDLVAEDDEGLIVIDHKVTKRMPAVDGGVDLQLALYAVAVEELYRPGKPVRLAHHVLSRTKVPRVAMREIVRSPHDTAEALEAVASGVELIHVAVGHVRPGRLLGRHRSWKCGSCSYRRRCGSDRT